MATSVCPMCQPSKIGCEVNGTDQAWSCFAGDPKSDPDAMIYPRRHVSSLFDLDNSEYQAVWAEVARVRKILWEKYNTSDFGICVADCPVTGRNPIIIQIDDENIYCHKESYGHVVVHVLPKCGHKTPSGRWIDWWNRQDMLNMVPLSVQKVNPTPHLTGLSPGEKRKFGGIECVWCPPGTFEMGSPNSEEGRWKNENLHSVTLSQGFWLSDHPTTQLEYLSVMGINPSDDGEENNPVYSVPWCGAVEYCLRLTINHRNEGTIPFNWEWRLPTEAEWEYAARAGTNGPRYGELDEIAWYIKNAGCIHQPVKGKKPNAWGIYDMLGNVWEWCEDWYGETATKPVTDPYGPMEWDSPDGRRVTRGGSCFEPAKEIRAAQRFSEDIAGELYQGFRPVLGPKVIRWD